MLWSRVAISGQHRLGMGHEIRLGRREVGGEIGGERGRVGDERGYVDEADDIRRVARFGDDHPGG